MKFWWEILQLGISFLGFSDFTDLLSKGLMAAVASLMEVYSIWIRGYLPIINYVTPPVRLKAILEDTRGSLGLGNPQLSMAPFATQIQDWGI